MYASEDKTLKKEMQVKRDHEVRSYSQRADVLIRKEAPEILVSPRPQSKRHAFPREDTVQGKDQESCLKSLC